LTTPTAARHSSKPLEPYAKKNIFFKKKANKIGCYRSSFLQTHRTLRKNYKQIKEKLAGRIACYRSSVEPPTAGRHSSKRFKKKEEKRNWTDKDPEINRL
jgi:hypothetical protein